MRDTWNALDDEARRFVSEAVSRVSAVNVKEGWVGGAATGQGVVQFNERNGFSKMSREERAGVLVHEAAHAHPTKGRWQESYTTRKSLEYHQREIKRLSKTGNMTSLKNHLKDVQAQVANRSLYVNLKADPIFKSMGTVGYAGSTKTGRALLQLANNVRGRQTMEQRMNQTAYESRNIERDAARGFPRGE